MYSILKDKNVLYIEDELDVLENISQVLSKFFNQIYQAPSAEYGLEIFETYPIDLMIVDIELPKMSGIEFIKKVRQVNKDIPIVIISAYTKTDYLLESIELKLEQYIVKPFTSQKIHKLLEYLSKLFLEENSVEIVPNVWLHRHSKTVSYNQEVHHLSKREFDILNILYRKHNITYDEISELWEDDVPSQNAIRSCIKHLRKKLPDGLIQNHSGVGYTLGNLQ